MASQLSSLKTVTKFPDSKNYNNPSTNGSYPDYLKAARVVCLAKKPTLFPYYPQVRTLAVLPSLNCVWEKCLLEVIHRSCKPEQLVHEEQRGFRKGYSTLKNIDKVA